MDARPLRRALVALLATAIPIAHCPTQDGEPPPLRVLTFNIRYGAADDGADSWRFRRDLVADVIRRHRPHVVGLQEALDFQVGYLRAELPGYGFVGQGREGGTAGEYAGVLFDRERLELLRSGDFWLSPTPAVVGSVGWDAALTRMVTWAVLRDRATDTVFRVWNTHFDHRGREARTRSGELLGARVAGSPLPDVVLGDLNAGEDSDALRALRAAGLRDTFRESAGPAPDATGVGTFHGFRGGTGGAKIDYVLIDDGFESVAAEIDRTARDGHHPSDHYPVAAALRFRQPGRQLLAPRIADGEPVAITAQDHPATGAGGPLVIERDGAIYAFAADGDGTTTVRCAFDRSTLASAPVVADLPLRIARLEVAADGDDTWAIAHSEGGFLRYRLLWHRIGSAETAR
ncbi:MAG: endonuclease/exonuclease/phosphatase family protein [Planctomycetes bacterium]|nr:endonuclease/exonuclease/phosphatase family protein [Planctomycetota bacterium]